MKHPFIRFLFIRVLSLMIFCSVTYLTLSESIKLQNKNDCQNKNYPIRTLFLPRSAGSNTARRLAGWQHTLPGCDPRVDGDFSVVVEYARSFDNQNISDYLFNGDCLTLIGSQSSAQNTLTQNFKLRADDLGLPRNFVGNICFKPEIENVVVDVLFHILLDPWLSGLFFKAFMPITHTRWNLGITKQTSNIDKNIGVGFEPCYMSTGPAHATTSICQALSGSFTFGAMEQPLNFGQFSKCRRDETKIADIDALFGINTVLTPCSHVAPFIIVTIPTGNKIKGEHFFEPIVGNGDHWELGGGCEGHYDLFRRDYSIFSISWFGHATYQFRTWQIRFYDLINQGPFSRYLLLKELDADCKYTGKLFNAIDLTSIATRAGGSIRVDASLKFSFYHGCWGWDLGYNLWARTEEKICIEPSLFPADIGPNRRLLLKGTQGVCNTQVKKSLLVDERDINLASSRIPTQVTNSFFTHISYTALNTWTEPQFGIGAQAEWATCNKLRNIIASLNQWRFWVKLGFAF